MGDARPTMTTTKNCPVCGVNPCYAICPTQDPYQGDQGGEDRDFVYEDLDLIAMRQERQESAHYDAQCDQEDNWGPDDDARR